MIPAALISEEMKRSDKEKSIEMEMTVVEESITKRIVWSAVGNRLSNLEQLKTLQLRMRMPAGLLKEQVPVDFHEPFILSGYRFHNIGARQSLRSGFLEPNNEAINVWTHFLPSVYFFWRFYTHSGFETSELLMPEDTKQLYLLPWKLYLLTLVTFPLLSALAHALNNMSVRARHLCFFIDYIGCSWYTVGAAVMYHAYSLPENMVGGRADSLFLWGAVINSVVCTMVACRSRFMQTGRLKKLVRLAAFAFPYLYDSSPLLYRLFTAQGDLDFALATYGKHFAMTSLAVFFYTMHVPERFFPGQFDIIGHSHQIFHIFSVLGSAYQLEAGWMDVVSRQTLLMNQLPIRNVSSAPIAITLGLFGSLIAAFSNVSLVRS